MPLEHIWADLPPGLRGAGTDSTYHVWLAPLQPGGFDDDTLLVEAPEEIRTWVADRFARVLREFIADGAT